LRPFTDVLRDMRKGRVVAAATDGLAELVVSVLETNKAGKLTLELSVKPGTRGDNAVYVAAKVTVKSPRPDLPEALFFADADGSLLRDDPTQQRIFADANAPHIDPETGEVLESVVGA
jgi:putative lipoic acid-binding regulatory protein